MDRYSEVEVKFAGDGIEPDRLQRLVDAVCSDPDAATVYRVGKYRTARGTDIFYSVGTGVVRFRKDSIRVDRQYNPDGSSRLGPSHVSACFTVKQRKTEASLLDRKEVDLWVGPQEEADVDAFFGLLGGKRLFAIDKDYHVWNLSAGGVHVCVAMYDVCRPDGSERRRFIEAEVERESTCLPHAGRAILNSWIVQLQADLGVGEPVNASLLELYGKVA